MNNSLLVFFILAINVLFAEVDTVQTIRVKQDTNVFTFVKTPGLFTEKWDTLAQPSFWRQIMVLSPDSCLLNVARTRQILHKESLKKWNFLSDDQKELARAKLRLDYGLDSTERIFMTTGKSDFYEFELV